jgi:acetyltransferase-like isoleucine patch superfamily enzyme
MNSTTTNASAQHSQSLRDALKTCSVFALVIFAWDFVARGICVTFCTARARLVLSLLRCRYGKGLKVDGKLIIRAPRKGTITLGNNVKINSRSRANLVGVTNPTILHCTRQGQIVIGNNSGFSAAVLSSRTSIQIGNNVKLGGNVRVYDHDYHAVDYLARRQSGTDAANCKTAPVVIGDDVFVGVNAIILKGVTIGARCVIGAGAVVSLKDIPPDSLVAGNPARILSHV